MNQILLHTEGDLLAVTYPVGKTTIEQLIEQLQPGTPHAVIDVSQLPEDRYFREAWKLIDGALVIDVELAKEIQRDHWRRLRSPKLAALDLAFMQALEQGQDTTVIVASKTALRDVTETELTGTLEEIRANIPAILL
jgi:hypothetical protein